jgi:hypothetical protein
MSNGPNGVQPVTDKFLGNGDMLGLKFNQGFVFLEVESYEQLKYAPFDNVGTVQPGRASNFSRLDTDDNDDVLYLENDQQKLIHASIGHSPASVRRYTNYPEGQNRLRNHQNLGTPTAGEDYGYVDGEDSPYEMPTDAEELFIPPKTHLDFSFANNDNREREPILNILMRIYRIKPLSPDSTQQRNAIKRIVSPGSPMPVVMAGGPDFQIDYDLRSAWNAEPVGEDRVERIKRGGN